ncbi:MAG: AtpZ/AtpI family protein [Bacteroidetes bacterium]|nr:AtpZ/AtpI family protein [Bacteroidota bacterium]
MSLGESWSNAANYSHLGITLAIMILLGFFGGNWLDKKLGWEPVFTISGAFLGATGGFLNLIKTLNEMRKKDENSERDQSEDE